MCLFPFAIALCQCGAEKVQDVIQQRGRPQQPESVLSLTPTHLLLLLHLFLLRLKEERKKKKKQESAVTVRVSCVLFITVSSVECFFVCLWNCFSELFIFLFGILFVQSSVQFQRDIEHRVDELCYSYEFVLDEQWGVDVRRRS